MNSMRHSRAASLPQDDPLRANIEAIVRGDHGDPFARSGSAPNGAARSIVVAGFRA